MELWVRSQDKRILRKVSEIYFDDIDSIRDDNCTSLGKYETEERALEVLDEIEEVINHLEDPKLDVSTFVYEMPKE